MTERFALILHYATREAALEYQIIILANQFVHIRTVRYIVGVRCLGVLCASADVTKGTLLVYFLSLRL